MGTTVPRDTIVAVSTPPGSGAISLVRVSGPEAVAVVARTFATQQDRALPARRPVLRRIADPADGAALDEALVTSFVGPRSYTGDDLVEIGLHGNPVVVARVLELLVEAGARPARPGEFTRRAFENGRLDLTRAEAVLAVIGAETLDAAKLAQAQLGGAIERRLGALQRTAADALGLVEATLEFPDDLDEASTRALADALSMVRDAIAQVDSLLVGFDRGARIAAGARIAITGRRNAGKSSIFNKICGEDRAIVTAEAGTTRDVLEARVQLSGRHLVLRDTAGLGDTDDPIEREGMARARDALGAADLVLWVVDGSEALTPDDQVVARQLEGRAGWVLLNKADLPQVVTPAEVAALAGGLPVVAVSAHTGLGLPDLEQALGEALDSFEPREPAPISSARQKAELDRVREHLQDGADHLSRERDEVAAEDLRAVLEALARTVGDVTDEELLDRIFARFCIGK